ncbi:MAG: hypothetical protein AB7K24_10490, partial [Gemmataceae bacterium]
QRGEAATYSSIKKRPRMDADSVRGFSRICRGRLSRLPTLHERSPVWVHSLLVLVALVLDSEVGSVLEVGRSLFLHTPQDATLSSVAFLFATLLASFNGSSSLRSAGAAFPLAQWRPITDLS